MTTYRFHTAATLDGFLATDDDSLDWLFVHQQDNDVVEAMMPEIGAIVMGATTYRWLLAHLEQTGEAWYYAVPAFVFTHGTFEPIDPTVRFVSGTPTEHRSAIEAAAGDRDVWVMGGGGLAAEFADAGMLQRLEVSIAADVIGSGRPLFTRAYRLALREAVKNGDFVHTVYDVLGPA